MICKRCGCQKPVTRRHVCLLPDPMADAVKLLRGAERKLISRSGTSTCMACGKWIVSCPKNCLRRKIHEFLKENK